MFKKTLYILIFIGFTNNIFCQEDVASEQEVIDNKMSLDINLLGIGINGTKVINNKRSLIYGVDAGYNLNLFIVQLPDQRRTTNGFVELLGLNVGYSYRSQNGKWDKNILARFALPIRTESIPFKSPYGGISFQLFYNISPKSSLGTNLDLGIVMYNNSEVYSLTNSLITYRILLNK